MGSIHIFMTLSTFLKPEPLINLRNIDNYSSEFFGGTLGIELGAAGWVASMLPLSYAALPKAANLLLEQLELSSM